MQALEPFRAALAVEKDAARAVDQIAEDLNAAGRGGSVGFLYATDRLTGDFDSIVSRLRDRTGIDSWVGTMGLGVMAGRQAVFDQPALAAMVGTWPQAQVKLYEQVSHEAAPPFPGDSFGMPKAIVHADPRNRECEQLLHSLSSGSGAYLIGGLTASRTQRFDQFVGKPTRGGVSGVFLGPDVDVTIGVAQGCVPIGPVRTISAAEGNVVTQLDGAPAVKALLEDLSGFEQSQISRILQSLLVALPIAHSDTGDYVVRNILSVDGKQGHIAIGETPEPGAKIFFCQRDRAAATKDLQSMVQKLKGRTGKVNGALYVSCCGRGPSVFESAQAEIDLVQSGLTESGAGDVPLVGFYANGEIAGDRIYGYTGVLALF